MDFLVIDDDKTFRDATCFLIENEGHYAEGAASGEQALASVKEEKFDAVLLDVNLGRESGLDVLSEMLKARPHLPVVMFSAQGSVKSAVEAMRRGGFSGEAISTRAFPHRARACAALPSIGPAH